MDKEITFPYFKMRKDFGRQLMFCEVRPAIIDSINPNKKEQMLYGLRNPMHQSTQVGLCQSEHYVNTKEIILHDEGINHAEGGWPKDINFNDEEATTRYRRKYERDDTYVNAVLNLHPELLHFIDQNNAIEMYNMYFKEMEPQPPVEKSSVRTVASFKDPDERQIGSISWTEEDTSKLVVCYCNKKYPVTVNPVNINLTCLVWDIENTNAPCAEFLPPAACWVGVCFPGEPHLIIGGLEDGRVCIFDIRSNKKSTVLSPSHLAHRDPVSALVFITSRQNNEFLSGSTDGQCMLWDVRNLSLPIECFIMSVTIPPGEKVSPANAEGVSSLQFDRAFPTKFLCGTDTGLIINVNRKGKTHKDVMSLLYKAHNGPVKAVHGNPSCSKTFISCGDWTTHVWSDEVQSSPIISGNLHRYQITDATWVPQRVSGYMTVCADGYFRYWDLLRKFHSPVQVLPISKYTLQKVVPNEEGRLVAVGDIKGTITMLSLSDNLIVSDSHDKQKMLQCFDRESRREHIIENKIKEIKMKLKTEPPVPVASEIDEQSFLKSIEDKYKTAVLEEMRRVGVTPCTNYRKTR